MTLIPGGTQLTPSDRAIADSGAEDPIDIGNFLETTATGTLVGMQLRYKAKLRGLRIKLRAPAGGNTSVQLRKNGVVQATATIAAADPANTVVQVGLNPVVSCNPDDTIELMCSAAGAGALGLSAYADIVRDYS